MTLPEWVAPLLERVGGRNPHGQPNYRIIWSEDALEYFFGEQVRRYGTGRDRWILEKWMPVEETEATWHAEYEQALGPYPRQGGYQHSWTFEIVVNQGEEPSFMPLSESIVELVVRAIEMGKMKHTDAERKAALELREEKIRAEKKRIFDDMWQDAAPAPGAKIPEHIQMMDSFGGKTTADLRGDLPTRGFKQLGDK